jgi:hypothetical protein
LLELHLLCLFKPNLGVVKALGRCFNQVRLFALVAVMPQIHCIKSMIANSQMVIIM